MRASALTGVAFAVCLVIQLVLTINTPPQNATTAKISAYYLAHKHRLGAAGLLTTLAVIFGIAFLYLRTHLRRLAGVDWLPSLFFVGALIFGVSGTIAGGVQFALSDSTTKLSPNSLQTLNSLLQNLNWTALSVGLALMYAGLAIAIVRLGIAPRWLAWVSWLLTVLSATFFLSFVALFVTPIWVIVVSIRMAIRNPVVE
jgi:hypothetical protein